MRSGCQLRVLSPIQPRSSLVALILIQIPVLSKPSCELKCKRSQQDQRSARQLADTARYGAVDELEEAARLVVLCVRLKVRLALFEFVEELTAYRLKRLRELPRLWSEQRRLLGFA